jgi:hypothetical protein
LRELLGDAGTEVEVGDGDGRGAEVARGQTDEVARDHHEALVLGEVEHEAVGEERLRRAEQAVTEDDRRARERLGLHASGDDRGEVGVAQAVELRHAGGIPLQHGIGRLAVGQEVR